MALSLDNNTHKEIEKLAQALEHYPFRQLTLHELTPSAVLVPLLPQDQETHMVFTKRNGQVKDHKHQIAFPGGMKEPQDKTLLDTALRECEEEISLAPQNVTILGRLSDLCTPTGYRITPFVGLLEEQTQFQVDPRETEEIFKVPLKHLLDPQNFSLQKAEFFGEEFDLPFYRYHKHTIWGATGRMVRELLNLLS